MAATYTDRDAIREDLSAKWEQARVLETDDGPVLIPVVAIAPPPPGSEQKIIEVHKFPVNGPDSLTAAVNKVEALDRAGKWDLYYGSPLPAAAAKWKKSRRGKEHEVAGRTSVTTDFDTKPGAFSSTDEIIAFLESLPPDTRPTRLVHSGSGGIHAHDDLDEPIVDAGEYRTLASARIEYFRRKSGKKVDSTFDATRVWRICGTTYRKGDPAGVRKVEGWTGPEHSYSDLLAACTSQPSDHTTTTAKTHSARVTSSSDRPGSTVRRVCY